jgi:hypothetical protein
MVASFLFALVAGAALTLGLLFWPPLQGFVIGLLQSEAVACPFLIAIFLSSGWGMKLKEVESRNGSNS